jgi:hypothetical protein
MAVVFDISLLSVMSSATAFFEGEPHKRKEETKPLFPYVKS